MLSFNMQHQEFDSPEELTDVIKCFWHNTIDVGPIQSNFEVQPDGYAEIIFYFGSLGSVAVNGDLQPLPSPFMIGLLNQPVVFYTQNRLDIIGIRCYPWTVFDLLGIPSGKDGLRIFEHPLAGLQPALSKLIAAGEIAKVISLLKQYFINERLRVADTTMLFKAGVAMSNAKGAIPVSEVAAAAHATVRTLERKFKQSAGYTVKDLSALMRFEQVRNHLWLNPTCNLAGLAHELGYADQSHLSREFKRYSGTTPAAFARKAKKGKQDVSNDFISFAQA